MKLLSHNPTKPYTISLDNNSKSCRYRKLSLRILKFLELTRHTNLLKIIFWIHVASLGLFSFLNVCEARNRYLAYKKSQTEANYRNLVFCLIIDTCVVFALAKSVVLLLLARRKYENLQHYLRWYAIWNSVFTVPIICLWQYCLLYFCLNSTEVSRWGWHKVMFIGLSIFFTSVEVYLIVIVILIYRKVGSKLIQEYHKVEFIRKANLRIPKINLFTDYTRILGEGQSGMVYYGELLDVTMNSIVHIPVAVKMANDAVEDGDDIGKSRVEAFIEEIKLLHLIGEHVNVVKLLGVCIEDFNLGRLSAAFEYYRNGSLESFLRKIRIEKQIDPESKDERNVIFSTLNKWVYEVANAMEFVSAKNIIHGDIATRNVLISSDLTAKLTDFGLSRKIYNYVNYIKTRQEPLPWRWMSPESLRDLEFSKKSDVWSFGVFTWEVFQFASLVPYFGISWCSDFVKELENGLIPHKPEFAQDNMYNLMKQCWTFHPDQRPSFTEIRAILQKKMVKIKNQSASIEMP